MIYCQNKNLKLIIFEGVQYSIFSNSQAPEINSDQMFSQLRIFFELKYFPYKLSQNQFTLYNSAAFYPNEAIINYN